MLVGGLDTRQCGEGGVLEGSVVGTRRGHLLNVGWLLVSRGRLCGSLHGCGRHCDLAGRREPAKDLVPVPGMRVTAVVVLLLPAPDGITRTETKSSRGRGRGREGEVDETLCRSWQGSSVKSRKYGLLLNNAYSTQQIQAHIKDDA